MIKMKFIFVFLLGFFPFLVFSKTIDYFESGIIIFSYSKVESYWFNSGECNRADPNKHSYCNVIRDFTVYAPYISNIPTNDFPWLADPSGKECFVEIKYFTANDINSGAMALVLDNNLSGGFVKTGIGFQNIKNYNTSCFDALSSLGNGSGLYATSTERTFSGLSSSEKRCMYWTVIVKQKMTASDYAIFYSPCLGLDIIPPEPVYCNINFPDALPHGTLGKNDVDGNTVSINGFINCNRDADVNFSFVGNDNTDVGYKLSLGDGSIFSYLNVCDNDGTCIRNSNDYFLRVKVLKNENKLIQLSSQLKSNGSVLSSLYDGVAVIITSYN